MSSEELAFGAAHAFGGDRGFLNRPSVELSNDPQECLLNVNLPRFILPAPLEV